MSISSNDSSFREGDGDSVRGIRPHIPGYERGYPGRRGRLVPNTAGANSFHATNHTTSARYTGDNASSRTSGHFVSEASQPTEKEPVMSATINFRDDSWQECFRPPPIHSNHPSTHASNSRNKSKESLTEDNTREYFKPSVNVSYDDRPPSGSSFADTRQGYVYRKPGSLHSVSEYGHMQEVRESASVLFPGLGDSLSLEEIVDAIATEHDWNDHQKDVMTRWLWQEDQKRRREMLKPQPGHHSDSAKDSSGVIQREEELQYNGDDPA